MKLQRTFTQLFILSVLVGFAPACGLAPKELPKLTPVSMSSGAAGELIITVRIDGLLTEASAEALVSGFSIEELHGPKFSSADLQRIPAEASAECTQTATLPPTFSLRLHFAKASDAQAMALCFDEWKGAPEAPGSALLASYTWDLSEVPVALPLSP